LQSKLACKGACKAKEPAKRLAKGLENQKSLQKELQIKGQPYFSDFLACSASGFLAWLAYNKLNKKSNVTYLLFFLHYNKMNKNFAHSTLCHKRSKT